MIENASPSRPPLARVGPTARAGYEHSILVLADQTATSEALALALEERAQRTHARFTLLIPGSAMAPDRLRDAVSHLSSLGLKVRGRVGARDPLVAVGEAWDPRHFDEIIVSTLPTQSSRWLRIDLPQRVRRLTGALVSHVISPASAPVEARTAHTLTIAR